MKLTIATFHAFRSSPRRFCNARGASLGQVLVLVSFMAAPSTAVGQPALTQPHDAKTVPTGLDTSNWSSIRAAYEAGRYEVQAVDGGHEARNPGQGWRTLWDGQGFLTRPVAAENGTWQWGLVLSSYGFAGAEQTVSGKATVRIEGHRLIYQWDSNVEEWYVNDGINNLLEFAFGRHPFQNSASQLPQPLFYPDAIHFEYSEPNTHMGLTYGAEWSTTLAPGSWTAIPDTASSLNHLFKFDTTGFPRVFVRLKVTAPTPLRPSSKSKPLA